MNYNLACAVHQHGLATPNALAVASEEGRSLSYGEVAAAGMRISACLQRSRAWRRQDGKPPRVGILASRGIDACLAVIGASWAGATYIPLGLKLPEERILTLLSLCDLSALIADEQGARLLSERVRGACPPLVLLAGGSDGKSDKGPTKDGRVELINIESLPQGGPPEPAHMAAGDTAYIIFTSGTTGTPKGVMIPAGSIRHYATQVTELYQMQASDRVLEASELSFDFSVHTMFSTWQAGASLHVLAANRSMNAVKFARAAQLTVWNSVPSLVGLLRQLKALGPGVLPSLRVTAFGGEQLPESLVAAWRSAAPNSMIINLYGPTEVTVCCLRQIVESTTPLTPGRDGVAIGTPVPGNEVAVVDPDGEPVADGTPGELAVSGVQLSSGYLNAPELTAARFPTRRGKRWYMTGDLALRDASGVFHWLGRIDNQVKVLGHRIELEEVDAHLRRAAQVDVVGAVAWPFVNGAAQGLVAFVGEQGIDTHKVMADLKTKLPAYMVPSRVIALADMPFSESGKVDRRALRQLLEAGRV